MYDFYLDKSKFMSFVNDHLMSYFCYAEFYKIAKCDIEFT